MLYRKYALAPDEILLRNSRPRVGNSSSGADISEQ